MTVFGYYEGDAGPFGSSGNLSGTIGNFDTFAAQLSSSTGNVEWATRTVASSRGIAYVTTALSSSWETSTPFVYTFGTFESSVQMGTFSLTSAGHSDAFVAK